MKVKICVGSHCMLLGSVGIMDQIEYLDEFIIKASELYREEEISIEAVKCLGFCKETNENLAPIIMIDDEIIYNATGQEVMGKILNKLKKD